VTSAFGLRFHPLLGFTRMHQGVDFGASTGAPVLAAGDGVVEETRWAGGYGRWLRIRHGVAVETGYGHLSAWAPGVKPGVRVRQGEVVGYVGDSGLATGPHLHFEVFDAGRRIDPRSAPATVVVGATPDPLFRSRRAAIDSEVSALAG
jgi:murein DD-endopeptidase MepM/ murein hydrolase activator NlpD